MIRAFRVWAVAIAIAFVAVPAAWAAQEENGALDPQGIERLKAATGGRAQMSIRRGTGAVQFVRLAEGAGEASLAPPSARGASATEQTMAFFAEYGSIFGIRNAHAELEVRGERTDELGFKHVTLQQVHNGVPVFGAELKGHVDAEGRLVAVNGTGVPGITVDTMPRRSAAEAGQVALTIVSDGKEASSVDGEEASSVKDAVIKNTRLVVYRTGLIQGVEGQDHLTYEVEVGNGGDVREFVFVDAHTGKKVDQVTGIHDALNRRAYDGRYLPTVPPSYPASPFWVEGDAFPSTGTCVQNPGQPSCNQEADNMILASRETYDAFWNGFRYDSFDGAGATMDAIFDRGYQCPNASWNGTFISFCPGLTTDDVTAHEWGHAYTQYTHNLIYQWQPGALNESYSDIWGETVDLINGRGVDTPGGPRDPEGANCSAFQLFPPETRVNSPANIAADYPSGTSAFSPTITFANAVTSDVIRPDDGVVAPGNTATDGCGLPPTFLQAPNSWTNAAQVAGKIVLIDRGLCGFAMKALNAQRNGAIGVIIANVAASGNPNVPPNMGGVTGAEAVTIPVTSMNVAHGNLIRTELGVPNTVNATLQPNAPGVTDNSLRWLMGEEIAATGLVGALRDMWNPTCFGNAGKVSDTQYTCSAGDNGGVHSNSGVPNHAYALLVDGGQYNNRDVSAIGLTKAAHLYFRASFYHVVSSDFPEHADALEQACNDLRGQPLASLTGVPGSQFITANDCVEVTKAIAAVELRTPPTQCNFQPQLAKNPPANVCGVGPANLLFSETVEGSIAAWTPTNQGVFAEYVPRNWVKNGSLPGGRTGSAFFAKDDNDLGDCVPGSDDQSGVVFIDSPAIAVPATPGFTRLAFDHYMASEPGWDGGNLKISVNGGPFNDVSFTRFTYNAYTFLLNPASAGNTNPLAGQEGWTGTDGGTVLGSWGKSILDLNGIAQPGDSVRVRYAFGTDGCGGNDGWYVDDVSVYQCTAGAAATVSINDVTVTEGDTGSVNAVFTLTLSEASAVDVTVQVDTANNTAVAPGDYTAVTNLLVTFPSGVTTRTVTVPVIGDLAVEGNEQFFVNLSNPINITILDGQGVGTITNNDFVVPAVSINDVIVNEGDSGTTNATFTLSLSEPTTNTVTVQVDTADGSATAGSDYTAVSVLVTFAPGVTTQTVDVPVLGDLIVELNETFFVNLSAATNATIADPQGLGTILNDDVPTVSIGDATVTEGNSGTSNATFTLTLSQTSPNTVTVQVDTADGSATAGSDYTAVSVLVTFAPGVMTQTVDVPVLGDPIVELDETFFVNLSAATNATILDGQGLGTIVNDDVPTVSIGDATVPEGNSGTSNATFTLTLSQVSPNTVMVQVDTADGTATAPSDYTAVSATIVTFNPGDTTKTVDVPVVGDRLVEGDETFFVNLSAPVNATIADAQGLGTITNDDAYLRGDFNDDGKTDILWRHATSGQNVAWFMDGAVLTSGTFLNPPAHPDTNWKMVGTHDFNADNKTDILWRHELSGENVVWYMDGVTRIGGEFLTAPTVSDTNWKIVGTGLFDAGTQPDIVWHHQLSGQVVVWYMNGSVLTSGTFTTPSSLPDTNWQIKGVADFNGDSHPDLLWHHRVSGQIMVWFMDNATQLSVTLTTPSAVPDTNWQIVAVGDYSVPLDGKPDIVWRHNVSGQNAIWFMDGVTLTSGVLTTPVTDTNWKIVGPR